MINDLKAKAKRIVVVSIILLEVCTVLLVRHFTFHDTMICDLILAALDLYDTCAELRLLCMDVEVLMKLVFKTN